MTEQSYAIDVGHPPSLLLRLVNPLLGLLLRTPLAGHGRTQFMVLNFTGRKTGRQFSLPVSAHVIDGDLYALTGAAWKANFRGGAPAQVLYDGKTTTMRGELVTDRTVVPELYLKFTEAYGIKPAQRMIGLKFREQRIPTLDEFAEAYDRMNLRAIRLTPTE